MIDIEDWKSNTIYRNYNETCQIIVWFWELVSSFTTEQKARFLQFVTGTSRIPATGFKDLWG